LHIRSWGANRKGKALLQATALQMRTLGAAAAAVEGYGTGSGDWGNGVPIDAESRVTEVF
jgi:hypothetical protein